MNIIAYEINLRTDEMKKYFNLLSKLDDNLELLQKEINISFKQDDIKKAAKIKSLINNIKFNLITKL